MSVIHLSTSDVRLRASSIVSTYTEGVFFFEPYDNPIFTTDGFDWLADGSSNVVKPLMEWMKWRRGKHGGRTRTRPNHYTRTRQALGRARVLKTSVHDYKCWVWVICRVFLGLAHSCWIAQTWSHRSIFSVLFLEKIPSQKINKPLSRLGSGFWWKGGARVATWRGKNWGKPPNFFLFCIF